MPYTVFKLKFQQKKDSLTFKSLRFLSKNVLLKKFTAKSIFEEKDHAKCNKKR